LYAFALLKQDDRALFRTASRSLLLSLLVVHVCLFTACQSERRPESIVERFLQAVNDKDFDAVLACVAPQQERMFHATFRIVEKITGGKLPLDDLLQLLPGLYQIFQDRLPDDFSVRDVRVYRAKLEGGEAEVPVILTAVTRHSGVSGKAKQTVSFHLRQFEEGWRIVGVAQK
jgi:hypothetical protein